MKKRSASWDDDDFFSKNLRSSCLVIIRGTKNQRGFNLVIAQLDKSRFSPTLIINPRRKHNNNNARVGHKSCGSYFERQNRSAFLSRPMRNYLIGDREPLIQCEKFALNFARYPAPPRSTRWNFDNLCDRVASFNDSDGLKNFAEISAGRFFLQKMQKKKNYFGSTIFFF